MTYFPGPAASAMPFSSQSAGTLAVCLNIPKVSGTATCAGKGRETVIQTPGQHCFRSLHLSGFAKETQENEAYKATAVRPGFEAALLSEAVIDTWMLTATMAISAAMDAAGRERSAG